VAASGERQAAQRGRAADGAPGPAARRTALWGRGRAAGALRGPGGGPRTGVGGGRRSGAGGSSGRQQWRWWFGKREGERK
jgi:hypothetical protein